MAVSSQRQVDRCHICGCFWPDKKRPEGQRIVCRRMGLKRKHKLWIAVGLYA